MGEALREKVVERELALKGSIARKLSAGRIFHIIFLLRLKIFHFSSTIFIFYLSVVQYRVAYERNVEV